MFEYLMPLLVMPPRPFSLLDQTCHSAVHRQMAYARTRGVPWGISESAYNFATGTTRISTARSECPISRSSAVWRRISSSRRTRPRWRWPSTRTRH